MKNTGFIITILITILVIFYLTKCDRVRCLHPSTFGGIQPSTKGGKNKVEVKKDTIILKDTFVIESKPKIIYKEKYEIILDTIIKNNFEIIIKDSLVKNDSTLFRNLQILKIDTIFKDTITITKTDTVFIKNKLNKKMFVIGFGVGFVSGMIINKNK